MVHVPLTALLILSGPPEPAAEPEPVPDAGGGPGAFAPLPNYDDSDDDSDDGSADPESDDEIHDGAPPVVELERPRKAEPVRFEEPEDYGPFFEPAPVTEVKFPGDALRRRKGPDAPPFASVGGGMFCFVEDSACNVSLLADADVGVGVNVVENGNGLDVPYTQFRVRGGFTVRPVKLARKRWHAWGVGLVGSWSIGSGSVLATDDVVELDPLRTWRVGLLNQLWLGQRRNALHLDLTFGGANSSVLDAPGRYWGTHAEVALGFGGWGALALSGDFLDQDARFVLAMRGHGIATGPMIALVLLGLVAGGVAL